MTGTPDAVDEELLAAARRVVAAVEAAAADAGAAQTGVGLEENTPGGGGAGAGVTAAGTGVAGRIRKIAGDAVFDIIRVRAGVRPARGGGREGGFGRPSGGLVEPDPAAPVRAFPPRVPRGRDLASFEVGRDLQHRGRATGRRAGRRRGAAAITAAGRSGPGPGPGSSAATPTGPLLVGVPDPAAAARRRRRAGAAAVRWWWRRWRGRPGWADRPRARPPPRPPAGRGWFRVARSGGPARL